MTRDFNKQRRENERPYSRSSSSGRYGEKRSPRNARPRLNREMVDRAWENGARQNHADYRTRGDNTSQPPRDNRRRSQFSDQSSAQNSRNNRKPYGSHQDNYRHSERPSHSKHGPRARSVESGMRNFNEQRYIENEHRAGSRSGDSENTRYSGTRSQFNEREQYSGSQRRDRDRGPRQPRSYERDQRQLRDRDRDSDSDSRKSRSYDRDKRSSRNGPQPNTQNPRWQSRPPRRRDNFQRRSQEFARRGSEGELFEGDYEHFDATNGSPPLASQTEDSANAPQQTEERHVTRLPDGRVLKGPLSEQRRNGEFWTDIAHETAELVQPVEPLTATKAVSQHSTDLPTATPAKGKPKSRTHQASTEARGKKAKIRQKNTPKSRSTGPKPSQRGYQWPAPEPEG